MSDETVKEDTNSNENAAEAANTSKAAKVTPRGTAKNRGAVIAKIVAGQRRKVLPKFRAGDTVKVHTKIVEGTKERIQIFQGVVIRRHKGELADATFTVRKISYNIGVERTFLLHSPRIEQIEVVSHGEVRRARLFYLRDLRGKAARIRSQLVGAIDEASIASAEVATDEGEGSSSTTESNGNAKRSGKSSSKGVEAAAQA